MVFPTVLMSEHRLPAASIIEKACIVLIRTMLSGPQLIKTMETVPTKCDGNILQATYNWRQPGGRRQKYVWNGEQIKCCERFVEPARNWSARGRVCRLHKELFRIPSRLFRLFLLSSSLSSRCGFPCRVRCLCHRITLFFTSLNTVATGFAEPVINSRAGPHNPDTAATLTYISTSMGAEICEP